MTPSIQSELVPVDDLVLDPNNAREHGEENLAAIRGSLSRFGQVKPLVVHRNTVLAGNGTLQVARELGWDKISVVRVPDDWSDDRAMAYALVDNRTGELAEWDDKVLSEQLYELDANGWDVGDLGFPELKAPNDPPPPSAIADAKADLITCPRCGFTFQDTSTVKGGELQ